MNRLVLLIVYAALFQYGVSRGDDQNGFVYQIGMSPMGPVMEAGIPAQSFAKAFGTQHMDELCWAASISNVFGYYGHVVPQEKIVTEMDGVLVNQPASPQLIERAINRNWTDTDGNTFSVKTLVGFDAYAGHNNISNNYILDQLARGHPILMCNTHHCMVITACDFVETPYGPNIGKVWVFDPWPSSAGPHPLPLVESYTADRIVPQIGQRGQCMFLGAMQINGSQ